MSNPNDIPYLSSVSNLRAIPTAACGTQYNVVVCVTQTDTSNTTDRYHWDSTSSAADNGTSIIKPSDNSGAGRWALTPATWLVSGGYANINQPVDEPANIENISTDSRVSCLGTTGYGTNANAILHFNKARGTQALPTMPLSGDNILSVGARCYDNVTNNFSVSSAAIEVYLTEDARSGSAYTGCYMTLEATPPGGSGVRQVVGAILGQGCFNVGSITYHGVSLWGQSNNGDRPFAAAGNGGALIMYTGAGSQTYASGENSANAALFVRKDSTTGRSQNNAGTVNASGADYADYETKADALVKIAKGDLCGYDADGYLTDKFSLAVAFGVKSTDPSFVGGDIHWAKERPKSKDEVDAWEKEYQAARANVDRIAKAGKVPCHVVGDIWPAAYVEAQCGPNDTIIGVCRHTNTGNRVVGKVRVVRPSKERIYNLISSDVPYDPNWTAIIEVMHS